MEEIMELYDDICYTICMQLLIPPAMDWASHRMTKETALIFYTCLTFIIMKYFRWFVLWINPSINVRKRILTPMIFTIIFTHGFNLVDEPSTLKDHICEAIVINWVLSRIFHWRGIEDEDVIDEEVIDIMDDEEV